MNLIEFMNKHKALSMHHYVAVLCFPLLLLSGPVFAQVETSPTLQVIEVLENSPFIGKTFYRVYSVGPLRMLQTQYFFDSSAVHFKHDSAGNENFPVTENEFREIRSTYFVYHQDSSYGLMFDPHKTHQASSRLLVDSTLKMITGGNNFENLMRETPDSSIWDATGTELREVYIKNSQKDTPVVRLVFYYSSRLNHLKWSLNAAVDSFRQMKFYKYECVIQEFFSEKTKKLWPEMKVTSEMKEVVMADDKEMMTYIERYKKHISGETNLR